MRIDQIRSEAMGNRNRVVARVHFESKERAPLDVFFETDRANSDALACTADPFLVGAILPAFRQGEKRVTVEGEVSPELLDGLVTVMHWLRTWFRPEHPVVTIEAKPAARGVVQRPPERAGFFFSGGVDSLATLVNNRRLFPTSHPGSIKDGLLVYGLEVEEKRAFKYAEEAVAEMAAESDVNLVSVFTNVRQLDDDWVFWRDEFQGAALASVGHALARRLTALSIAATYDAPNMGPWGSHPLVDPNFSTSTLRVHHDGVALSRLDKVRLLLNWPTSLRRLRVCNKAEVYSSSMLNCGHCEKCIRTMLELLAVGALERSGAFPATDLDATTVGNAHIHDGYVASCYRELLEPLAERGRADLVLAVRKALGRFDGTYPANGWRGTMKRLDRRLLNGRLIALKRSLERRPSAVGTR